MTDSINYNFVRIRIESYNPLPIEKTLALHHVISWLLIRKRLMSRFLIRMKITTTII